MTTNDAQGTLFLRKRKGRKLQFMIGGPTLDWAYENLKWDQLAGHVVEHHSQDGVCSVVPRPVQS